MSARLRLLIVFLIAATALAVASASAAAAVSWRITSAHGPQNMQPGGAGQYVLSIYNVGDTDAAGKVTITDVLPPGFTATSVVGSDWNCGATSFPATTVTCSQSVSVPAAGADALFRGAGPQLIFNVVAGSSPGTFENLAKVSGGGPLSVTKDPTTVSATPAGFGFARFSADAFDAAFPGGAPVRQAGSHPFEMRVHFGTNLRLSEDPDDPAFGDLFYTAPEGSIRTLETRLATGLIGNPQATPRCPGELANETGRGSKGTACPPNTQVGTIDLLLSREKQVFLSQDLTMDIPVYNMVPPPGAVAALGFAYVKNPVWIVIGLDPKDHYSVQATVPEAIELAPVRSAELSIWGVPADPAHDPLRMDITAPEGHEMDHPFTGAPVKPFLTLPSQCDTPAGSIEMRADSWQNPGAFTPWAAGTSIQATGCDDPRFQFHPSITIQPTSHEAAAPTGLDVELSVPQRQASLANASEAGDLYAEHGKDAAIDTPPLRDAVVSLPAGMAVNPSAADGLAACTPAQIDLHTNDPVACPDASKLGSVELTTPVLDGPVPGSVYLAAQNENPFGSLLALYVVLHDPERGLLVKLPAEVRADPVTGQLTTSFTENPQLPFDHLSFHLWGGDRAPLVNPPTCGSHTGSGTFTAWNSSLPALTSTDVAQITTGPGGGPCPNGLAGRPFAPGFDAKSLNPLAGAFSSFAVDISRAEGSQELSGVETSLPAGLLARLAGVPYCPEATIAAISPAPGSGAGERARPACPAASLLGHIDASAGAGPLPFHNPGSVYLAGPYKGAPLSLAIVTPVIGGPLDLGTVIVRAALFVDPESARVRVVSDPLPSILQGIPLNLRSVRVAIDRPNFTLNPTSCEAMSVGGTLTSLQGAVATVSDPFRVDGCKALAFKPKLALRLKGGSARGDYPALRATLTLPTSPLFLSPPMGGKGTANVKRAVVSLPHSEFLAQNHIGTVCTRMQFAAEACPKRSVYGHAKAISPLLDRPLEGPVYLRSSDHPLPDLVAALHGQIDVDLAGRIDSHKGGIRSTFETVPDAPVSKFVLSMAGGKKGLLENSRNLCRSTNRAVAKFGAHNGRVADLRPVLRADCAKRSKGKRHRIQPG